MLQNQELIVTTALQWEGGEQAKEERWYGSRLHLTWEVKEIGIQVR